MIDDIVESVLEYTKISDLKIIFDTEVEDMIIAIDIYDFKRIILNLIVFVNSIIPHKLFQKGSTIYCY